VLDGGNGIGTRILARTGAALDDFRSDIVGRFTGGVKGPESDERPFSASCEPRLRHAAEVGDRQLHSYMTSHQAAWLPPQS
jgi:hypothetical protein